MKICICCSLTFTDEVMLLASKLQKLGHEVMLPNGITTNAIRQPDFNPVEAKHDTGYDAIRTHMDKIKTSDVVLLCNYSKNGIKNYIGANTFMEAGLAYYFHKPIYALYPLPHQDYIRDEIQAMDITVINGNLNHII